MVKLPVPFCQFPIKQSFFEEMLYEMLRPIDRNISKILYFYLSIINQN